MNTNLYKDLYEVIYHCNVFIENVDKDEVIATFLSVLELIKSREIVVYQDLFFDDILIKKNLES